MRRAGASPPFAHSGAGRLRPLQTPRPARADVGGRSFLSSARALGALSVTPLVDLHVRGQRNNLRFLKGLENIERAPLFPFGLGVSVNY